MQKTHTDREYENQLQELKRGILLMAGRVEEMIAQATQALLDDDLDLAQRTIQTDRKVNQAEVDTDELCMRILARRQPMASDLRFITFTLKMDTDLERIGDLAVNICERAVDLDKLRPLKAPEGISEMASYAQSMVRDAIDAFVQGDETKAREVIERDDRVDKLYHVVFRDILDQMMDDSTNVERGIHLLSVAKWLERMADHSTNIAEQVIFMVKGQDIRHKGKLGVA